MSSPLGHVLCFLLGARALTPLKTRIAASDQKAATLRNGTSTALVDVSIGSAKLSKALPLAENPKANDLRLHDANNDTIPAPPPLYFCFYGLHGECYTFSYGQGAYVAPRYLNDSVVLAREACLDQDLNTGLTEIEQKKVFGIGSCDSSHAIESTALLFSRTPFIPSNRWHSLAGPAPSPVVIPPAPALYHCHDGLKGECFSFSYGQGSYTAENYPKDILANAKIACHRQPSNQDLTDAMIDTIFGNGACTTEDFETVSKANDKPAVPGPPSFL